MKKKTKAWAEDKIVAIHNPPMDWLRHRMTCLVKGCGICGSGIVYSIPSKGKKK